MRSTFLFFEIADSYSRAAGGKPQGVKPLCEHINFIVILFKLIIVFDSLVLLVLDWQLYILSSVPLLHESSTFVWGVLREWPDML